MNKIENRMNELNINYMQLSDMILDTNLDISPKRLEDIANEEREPTRSERRHIEMVLGDDVFPELPKYNDLCEECNKKCKQLYWIDILNCPKHKRNK